MILPSRIAKITGFVKKAYHSYFGVKLGDQDKAFAPHVSCKTCVENPRDWENGKRKSMPFAVPMVWREGKYHVTDCYFCMTNLQGINRKNKHCVQYHDIPSAIIPVPHGPSLPVPKPDVEMQSSSESDNSYDRTEGAEYWSEENNWPVPLTQADLNVLTRDLNLSKESSQLLGSCLLEKKLLAPQATFYWYQEREREFRQFFSTQRDLLLVYCNNIADLMKLMGINYSNTEWRPFIDSSSRGLKAVLLHNGNEYSSIPIGHSVQMKVTHGSVAVCPELPWPWLVDLRTPKGFWISFRTTWWVHEVPMLSVFVG